MKPLIYFICCFLITFTSVKAQQNKRSTYSDQKFLVSLAPEAAIVLGANASLYSYILGAGGQLEYKPSSTIAITGNLAYLSYVKKDTKVNGVTNYGGTIAFITALAGLKYTFPNDFFLHLQAGLAHSQSGSGTRFCFQPGVGYVFSRNFDAEIKLNSIKGVGVNNSNLSSVAARIAYNF